MFFPYVYLFLALALVSCSSSERLRKDLKDLSAPHLQGLKSSTVAPTTSETQAEVAEEKPEDCFVIQNDVLLSYLCTEPQVIIPQGVTSIKEKVFENKNLSEVTLPEGLIKIGAYSFKGNDIRHLDIPESVSDVGEKSFSGNSRLSWVYLPHKNPTVGLEAFPQGFIWGAVSGRCFKIQSDRKNIIVLDYKNRDSQGGDCPRDVVIPNGITSIKDRAFQSKVLTSVFIPDSVTSLGIDSFANNVLSSVRLSENLKTIRSGAFLKNYLTSITFPEGLIIIEDRVFLRNYLKSLVFPKNLVSIGVSAFLENTLESVTFTEGLQNIEGYAFSENSLSSIIIPKTVVYVGNYAFAQNPNLSSVCIENEKSKVRLGYLAFAKILPIYKPNQDCQTDEEW